MDDHAFWRTGDPKRRPQSPASTTTTSWGSSAARAAVYRTCHQVRLCCQRVVARYHPAGNKPIAVGDPDPAPALDDRACGFEWADEISPDFVLHWRCTRAHRHQGQHVAGTGERVAAVHLNR